eukprot:scaffold589224_cov28-Prasinocladus_malaysianus.AAC.1
MPAETWRDLDGGVHVSKRGVHLGHGLVDNLALLVARCPARFDLRALGRRLGLHLRPLPGEALLHGADLSLLLGDLAGQLVRLSLNQGSVCGPLGRDLRPQESTKQNTERRMTCCLRTRTNLRLDKMAIGRSGGHSIET